MTDDPANFRELYGVGPATEAELQEAGVRTWSSLAEVLSALLRVKGVAGDTLRGLRDEARRRASEATVATGAGLADHDHRGDRAGQQAAVQPNGAEDAEREDSSDAQDGASREHTLSLHAGELIGGHGRTVDLTLTTAEVNSPHLTYDARLVARTYGRPQAAWATLGRQSGQAAPPEEVLLHFADVDLAVGIHRMRLDLTVTLPAPSHETPAITLV